jgi:protein TonB
MSQRVDPDTPWSAPPHAWHGQGGWRQRAGGIALAALWQAGLVAILLLGLSPDIRRSAAQTALAAFPRARYAAPTKTVVPHSLPEKAALTGAAGVHAVPRAVIAPVPPFN